jgi:hypothetical protein
VRFAAILTVLLVDHINQVSEEEALGPHNPISNEMLDRHVREQTQILVDEQIAQALETTHDRRQPVMPTTRSGEQQ